MTKQQHTGRGGETWEWEETPEVIEALKKYHETVGKNKAIDDMLNYDTYSK